MRGQGGVVGHRCCDRNDVLLGLRAQRTVVLVGNRVKQRADAVLLSPVFATRSHPGGARLGPLRFRLLAAKSRAPVIALGGMNHHTARRLRSPRWAAIDGLS